MNAVILCAGQGKRLIETKNIPKILLSFAGKTLLMRHLLNLSLHSVQNLFLVVGYEHRRIVEVLESYRSDFSGICVECIYNPLFEKGSLYSLYLTCEVLKDSEEGALIMDADVLYHPSVLQRLVTSKFQNALLVEPKVDFDGEEMLVFGEDERPMALRRAQDPALNQRPLGENVGFFKLCYSACWTLCDFLNDFNKKDQLNLDYEVVLNQLLTFETFGFERLEKNLWIEIDFQDDIKKAFSLLPYIDEHDFF